MMYVESFDEQKKYVFYEIIFKLTDTCITQFNLWRHNVISCYFW